MTNDESGRGGTLNKSFLQLLSYSLDLIASNVIVGYLCTDTLKPGPLFKKDTRPKRKQESRPVETEED